METNFSEIKLDSGKGQSGISSIIIYSVCLILAIYLLMNIMAKTGSENKILALNLIPENLELNFVKGMFILIIYLLAKEPQNILKGHAGGVFGATVISIVYFIIFSQALMNKLSITQEDVDNGKENQKSALYWVMFWICGLICAITILFSLQQTHKKSGAKALIAPLVCIIGFSLMFTGIILLRNKESTDVNVNIGFISLATLFFTSNPLNSGFMNGLQIILINIFLLYTFIFGNILPITGSNNSLGEKVKNYCKKLLEKKDNTGRVNPSLQEIKQELHELKNSDVMKNKERINNIQWIMTALSVCIMVAVITFLLMYNKN